MWNSFATAAHKLQGTKGPCKQSRYYYISNELLGELFSIVKQKVFVLFCPLAARCPSCARRWRASETRF